MGGWKKALWSRGGVLGRSSESGTRNMTVMVRSQRMRGGAKERNGRANAASVYCRDDGCFLNWTSNFALALQAWTRLPNTSRELLSKLANRQLPYTPLHFTSYREDHHRQSRAVSHIQYNTHATGRHPTHLSIKLKCTDTLDQLSQMWMLVGSRA